MSFPAMRVNVPESRWLAARGKGTKRPAPMNEPADADAPRDDGGGEDDELNPRQILVGTGVAIVVVLLVSAALGRWFREPLQELSREFVERLGGPGIAIGYLIPDGFSVPFPNDTFGMFGIEGGMAFWVVVMWGTAGSIAGGCVGYLIGGKLRRIPRVDRFIARRGRKLEAMTLRYGVWVVAVAALTPVPYSLSAWAAGAVRMPFGLFLATSLLRLPRVAGGLYLIALGLLAGS
jgi:membrane protein YqaA with SNARE-associated domain